MNHDSYKWIRVGVVHDAYYKLGGKCKIKKAAEDVNKGLVTAILDNGERVQRHFSFFEILPPSEDQTF